MGREMLCAGAAILVLVAAFTADRRRRIRSTGPVVAAVEPTEPKRTPATVGRDIAADFEAWERECRSEQIE